MIAVYGLSLAQPIETPIGDFVQEWASARNFLTGSPVYRDLSPSMEEHTGVPYAGFAKNAHPPASILLVVPFALLDFGDALKLWNVVWMIVMMGAVWVALRQPGIEAGWSFLPVLAVILVGRPLEEEFQQGQLNRALCGLIVVGWVLARRGASGWAGAALGAAAAIKVLPAVLGLFFLARRDWRGVAGMAAGFGALNLIALAAFGWSAFGEFVAYSVPQTALSDEYWLNTSVRSLFVMLFDSGRYAVPLARIPWLPTVAQVVVAVSVLGGTAWSVSKRGDIDRGFAACCLAMLLVSPVLWEHYYLLAFVPIVVLVRQSSTPWERWALAGAVLVWTVSGPGLTWPIASSITSFPMRNGAQMALPIHAATVLALPLYSLVVMWCMAAVPAPDPDTRK